MHAKQVLSAAAALVLIAGSGNAAVITYHRFENVGGDVSFDSSGNGQDGIVKTSVATSGVGLGRFTGGSGGKFGGALYFDDPYGDSTFAQFTSDFDISSAGSISLFVEHDFVGYRQAYLRGGAGDFSLEMHTDGTVFSSMPGGDTYLASGAKMDASGTWRHVVVTWDAANGNSQRLYIDGVLQREASNCCIDGLGSTFLDKIFTLGQRIPQGSAANERSFDGGVDDLAFWNRQLSDAEIAQIGAGGASTVPSGLVVHWNLDDPVGTLVAPSNDGSHSLDLLVGGGAGTMDVGPDLVGGAGPTIQGSTLDAALFDDTKPTSPSAYTKITIPDSPVMDFDKTKGSVVMWVKKLSTGYGETYLGSDDSTAEILLRSSNSGRTIMRVNGDAAYETAPGESLLNDLGQWHHLAFTWNATTGAHTIYVDGIAPPQGIVEGAPGPWNPVPVSDTGNWMLGFDIPDRPLRGYIADFAVFDQELTQEEIADIIDGGVEDFIGCSPMDRARLRLKHVTLPTADRVKFQGSVDIAGTEFDTIDPSVTGARFRIEGVDQTAKVDVVIPPGLRPKAGNSGWRKSIENRRWVYRNLGNAGDSGGIIRFVIADDSPGLRITVRGRDASYPVTTGDVPVRVVAALGNTIFGQCGDAAYSADQCLFVHGDRRLECELP